jgi:asparagine synthetase B (glutamine-hydrolysing)
MSSAVVAGFAEAVPRFEVTGDGESPLVHAKDDGIAVVWGDVDQNTLPANTFSAAEALLSASLRGEYASLQGLRGSFAAVVWDGSRRRLFAIRDPLGAHPLFYRRTADGIVLSPSADEAAGRDPAFDPVALAAYLVGASLSIERTLHAEVRRVPPGHILELTRGGASPSRYWSPETPRTGADEEESLERFASALRGAVSRAFAFGDCGVYLSGGLDSAAIATALSDVAMRAGIPPPPAIMVLYRGTEYDEEAVQRTVAAALGLPVVPRTPQELLGTDGFLSSALELAGTPGAPPQLVEGMYDRLALVARKQGCSVILSGIGGDDRLLPPPVMAADALRQADVSAVVQLARAWLAYWPGFGLRDLVGDLLWPHGVRPLLVAPADRVVERVARHRMAARRVRRTARALPKWLDSRSGLLEELAETIVSGRVQPPLRGLAGRSRQMFLEHPATSIMLEQIFAASQRTGVRVEAPLLDPDVISVINSLPPVRLVAHGRAKALAAEFAANRVAAYRDHWPATVYGDSLWRGALAAEGATAWASLGGVPALAGLGVINETRFRGEVHAPVDSRTSAEAARIIRALILEYWLQMRILPT